MQINVKLAYGVDKFFLVA